MTLFGAIVASSLLALVAYPYARYQYWFSWSPSLAAAGTICHFLLAGTGGGALGWATARWGNAQFVGNAFMDGLLIGSAGAIAIRADLALHHAGIPKRVSGGSAPDPTKAATSLLSIVTRWLADALDNAAERGAERWFLQLPPPKLAAEGIRIQASIANMERVSKATADQVEKLLTPHVESLRTARPEDDVTAPVFHLATFCSKYYVGQRLPKPVPVAAG